MIQRLAHTDLIADNINNRGPGVTLQSELSSTYFLEFRNPPKNNTVSLSWKGCFYDSESARDLIVLFILQILVLKINSTKIVGKHKRETDTYDGLFQSSSGHGEWFPGPRQASFDAMLLIYLCICYFHLPLENP